MMEGWLNSWNRSKGDLGGVEGVGGLGHDRKVLAESPNTSCCFVLTSICTTPRNKATDLKWSSSLALSMTLLSLWLSSSELR